MMNKEALKGNFNKSKSTHIFFVINWSEDKQMHKTAGFQTYTT